MFKLFKKNKSEPNSDSVKKPLFAKKEKGDGEQTQPAKKSLFGKKTNTETADKPAKKSTFSLKKNKAQSDNHGADTTQPKTQGSQASIDELITDDNKTKKLIIALGVLLALVLVALAAKLFLFPDQPTNDTAPAVIDTPAQVDNTPTDNAEQAEPSDTSTPSDTLSDVAPNDTPAAAQVPVSEPQNPEVQNTAAQNTAETVAVSPSSTTAKTDNNAAQSTPPAPTSEPMSKEEFLKEAEQRIYRERSTAPSK